METSVAVRIDPMDIEYSEKEASDILPKEEEKKEKGEEKEEEEAIMEKVESETSTAVKKSDVILDHSSEIKKRERKESPVTTKKRRKRSSCEPIVWGKEEAMLAVPSVLEVRLLGYCDGTSGAIMTEAAERFISLWPRLEDKVSRGIVLLMLERSSEKTQTKAVACGCLTTAAKWLAEDEDDEVISLVLQVIKKLPITKQALKESGIGKLIKKIKQKAGRINAEAAGEVMETWLEYIKQNPQQAIAPSRNSSIESETHQQKSIDATSDDPIATELNNKILRQEQRRSGKGGGIQRLSSDSSFDIDEQQKAKRIASRPLDSRLGDMLARAKEKELASSLGTKKKKVHWADDSNIDLEQIYITQVTYSEDHFLDTDTKQNNDIMIDDHHHQDMAEKSKREHEAEKRALEQARADANKEREKQAESRLLALQAMKPNGPWIYPRSLKDILPKEEDDDDTDELVFFSNEASNIQPHRIRPLIEAAFLNYKEIPKTPDEKDPELQIGPQDFSNATKLKFSPELTKTLLDHKSAPAAAAPPAPQQNTTTGFSDDIPLIQEPKYESEATPNFHGIPPILLQLEDSIFQVLLQNEAYMSEIFLDDQSIDEGKLARIVNEIKAQQQQQHPPPHMNNFSYPPHHQARPPLQSAPQNYRGNSGFYQTPQQQNQYNQYQPHPNYYQGGPRGPPQNSRAPAGFSAPGRAPRPPSRYGNFYSR